MPGTDGSLTRVFLILIVRWLNDNFAYRLLTGNIYTNNLIHLNYNKEST